MAYGINNAIWHSSPDIIVLGGSVMNNKISIKSVEKYLIEIYTSDGKIPSLVRAELGDIGGLYGAMQYAKNIN